MAQVLLSVYSKHFDSLNKGVGPKSPGAADKKLSKFVNLK